MNKLLEQLSIDYPELKFRTGKRFSFRWPNKITAEEVEYEFYELRLLHEMGHALLGHRDFGTDLERLKMERAAWEKARELSERYEVEFDEEFVEGELDTYRDWLHQRSKCPRCGLTRYQTKDGKYHCPLDE